MRPVGQLTVWLTKATHAIPRPPRRPVSNPLPGSWQRVAISASMKSARSLETLLVPLSGSGKGSIFEPVTAAENASGLRHVIECGLGIQPWVSSPLEGSGSSITVHPLLAQTAEGSF